ncbi:hypothetical protein K435DRAFT_970937 [Dendrothele bispora CBS 962.96]|uniref:Uncharacterized protein n=1 Tax=Dendrothele bispora (strain CBS 962.96) TaxID=1314807 RepID=A0A4S8L8C0_DENBC|nr:hypothetical protein K435DRAFT_970937 [Dendrothele bispora CBS 962.96]
MASGINNFSDIKACQKGATTPFQTLRSSSTLSTNPSAAPIAGSGTPAASGQARVPLLLKLNLHMTPLLHDSHDPNPPPLSPVRLNPQSDSFLNPVPNSVAIATKSTS